MERPVKEYIQDLIIDTENAVRHIDNEILIALTHNKISQIKNSNTTNILHKGQLHIIKQIFIKLLKIINNNTNR